VVPTDQENKDIAVGSLKSVYGSHAIFVFNPTVKHLAIIYKRCPGQLGRLHFPSLLTLSLDKVLQHF
jgi:hypothetical protein